jgi:Zn-dependent protease with chaperone function
MSMETSTTIAAQWFDGHHARRSEVLLHVDAASVQVKPVTSASEATTEAAALMTTPVDKITVSERIGNTPYRLSFPDGSLAVTSDHAGVEAAFRLAPDLHWLTRMERASWFVVIAMLGLAAAIYFAYQAVIPVVAEAVAQRVPREAEKTLGDVALQGLDRWLLKTSRLDAKDLSLVRKTFESLADKAGLSGQVELQFREMAPNALALPGGTVVVTDGLVQLFGSDERLLAGVIAHELGHIHHRHSLRHLLEGSASALLVGALVGDVSGVSALTTAAPLTLSTLHYTRAAEREADEYAFDLLKKAGRSPLDFSDAMRRFEAMELCFVLRAKLRDREGKKTWTLGDPKLDEEDDADARPGAKSTPARPLCYADPQGALVGREAEIAELRKVERETGYMHTHPVTQERIRAAEAANSK